MRMHGHSNSLETNVENETQEFGIKDASVVIEILRNNLYSYKVRTPVQEYTCNARDAMREIGKGNGFEITVPNRLNPLFKVRDFGPGISVDRMRDVFINYGASTKRDTDGQTGGFGIGAKSAWAYTDSFTVVSIVDGKRRTYVAHTGVNHNGRLDLISVDETDEANGTEIQIAVKPTDLDEFRSAIFRAIYYWAEKPTLKGELHPPTLVRGLVISDTLEVVDYYALPEYARPTYQGETIALIDGVLYSIDQSLTQKVKSLFELNNLVRSTVILHFGNGLVDLSASREKISDSPRTIAALEKLAAKALIEAKTYIADAFGKIKSTPEYLQTYAKLSKSFAVDEFAKYGDYRINSSTIENQLLKKIKMTFVHTMDKYKRRRIDKITKDELGESRRKIDMAHLDHLFFISKDENKLVQNKRIREHFKKNDQMVLLEVLHTSTPELDVAGKPVLDKDGKPQYKPVSYPAEFKQIIEELGAKDFCSLTYVDPPKAAKVKVKREDEAVCLHGTRYGTRHNYTTLAKNTQKWIYVALEEGQWPNKCTREMATELGEYTHELEDMKVCGVAEKALKTIAGNSNFISLDDWLKDFKPTKDIISAAKAKLAKNAHSINAVSWIINEVDDPLVTDMYAEYKAISKSKVASVPSILANKLADIDEIKEFKKADEKFGLLMESAYPLVQEELDHYSKNKKEYAFYMNAKYKARKGSK